MMIDTQYATIQDGLAGYGAAARELIRTARNRGEIRDPDSVGRTSVYHCKGRIEVQLSVDRQDRRIREAGYLSTGCPATTAALSLATDLVRGRTVRDVSRLDWCEVMTLLGAVPPETEGCVRAAVVAVREAAYDYIDWVTEMVTVPGIPSAAHELAADSAAND